MVTACIFPGQGAQFSGMGKNLFEQSEDAKRIFEEANDILGFDITDIMFNGEAEALKQTNITQPAIFIHSIAAYKSTATFTPNMVAGHSLGEFSALVANGALSFAGALKLVAIRAKAMQHACEVSPGTMAAILGLADEKVEEICQHITNGAGETVVAANYNCPGQLVISGSVAGIELACGQLKEAGAKRAMVLPVGGAFHSPLMLPAKNELADAINATSFSNPLCPIYQNVSAEAVTDPALIKENLIAQLTGAVKWTQIVKAMVADGAEKFIEFGPGKVLQGLVLKICAGAVVEGIN